MTRLWIIAVMIVVGIVFAGYAAWGGPSDRLELTLVAQQKLEEEQEAQQQPKPPAEEIRDARQEAREVTQMSAVPQQESGEVGTSEAGSGSATVPSTSISAQRGQTLPPTGGVALALSLGLLMILASAGLISIKLLRRND